WRKYWIHFRRVISSARLCENSAHGSRASPRAGCAVGKIKYFNRSPWAQSKGSCWVFAQTEATRNIRFLAFAWDDDLMSGVSPHRLKGWGAVRTITGIEGIQVEAATLFWSWALLLIFFILASATHQVPPPAKGVPLPVDPTDRSGDQPPLPKEFEAPTPPPGTLLPPAPIPPETQPFPSLRVFVREIRVVGS